MMISTGFLGWYMALLGGILGVDLIFPVAMLGVGVVLARARTGHSGLYVLPFGRQLFISLAWIVLLCYSLS